MSALIPAWDMSIDPGLQDFAEAPLGHRALVLPRDLVLAETPTAPCFEVLTS